jgi:hypothetical protein
MSPVQANLNNNPHFFVGTDISYVTPSVLSGAVKPSPIYKYNYLDLDLGGYFTNRDAYFSSHIPQISDFDDWFYTFDLPVYKMPWIINWNYATKSNNPDNSFSFEVYKKDVFISWYNKSPGALNISKLGTDRGISDSGVHSLAINDSGSFLVRVRTSNTADIASWWVKYGGQKYGP